jgi:hypothetical protein
LEVVEENEMRIYSKLFIILLIVPMMGSAVITTPDVQEVLVIFADDADTNSEKAIDTIYQQLDDDRTSISKTNLASIGSNPSSVDAIVFVGHGSSDGLIISDEVLA